MLEKGYPNEFTSKLKSACNIVSVISKYVPLSKKGRTYWGCCPFHHEKTPSFQVNEFEGYYHCFGCGEAGDVIKFVQKIEGLDFISTIKKLADSVNMPVPEFNGDGSILKRRQEKERLVYICTETAKYYHNELLKPSGKAGMEYLKKRGVENSTITKMGLGYSPNWQGLITYLKALKISEAEMLKAGVISTKNNRNFDCMAERLVFPIFDNIGKVVGFSGRALKDTSFAKYKNTQGTDIFNKSTLLFGINNLRKARVENRNYALLVEGQMDVVSLYQAGFTNAIATLGTAFNENHINTIAKFVDAIYICFDGDNAGKHAAEKSVEILKNSTFDIKVVTLPEKLDPDEYIKKYGAEKFEQELENAQTVKEFQINCLAEKFDFKDKNNYAKFTASAINLISTFNNVMDRDLYLKKVAEIASVNEETLKRELNKKLLAGQASKQKLKQEVNKPNKLLQAETYVLACRLYKKSYAKNVNSELFENNFYKQFNQYLIDNNPLISQVLDDYDIDSNEYIKQIINFNFDKLKDEENEYKGCLRQLELRTLLNQQSILQEKLKTASESEKLSLLNQLQLIIKQIQSKKTEE